MAYKVPFVNYPRHYHILQKEIDAAIKEVLNGGDLIMRRQLQDFETNLASFVGVDYAIGLNSGTDALLLSLLAAGIGPGDEVITVAHTFVASVAAIIHCGAKPVLIDVADDFNMDMDRLEPAITPQTRAIMPVHLNGRLCDMARLMTIARKHNLMVIEDAAQALGGSFEKHNAGTFGLTGCFSFYPAKILGAFGDGGALVTNSQEIDDKVRLLRDHGQERATGDILGYGFNSRLDNMQAALLDVKLRHLPQWISRRHDLAARYEQGLSAVTQIKTPPPPDSSGSYHDVYTNYVIRAERRDELAGYLRERGIEVLISWPKPMHHNQALGLSHFKLPKTEKISREVISLPLYPELEEDQLDFVVASIRRFYKQ